MIGLRAGLVCGLRSGLAAGVSADELAAAAAGSNPMASVSRDAASGIYCPATAGEWTTTMGVAGLGSGNPSSTYLMQEASGNLADSLAAGITLTAAGASLTYQQAVAGWTRKAFTTPDGLASHNAQNTTTAVDISTTSALWLVYLRMPAVAPAAVRSLARVNATGMSAKVQATSVMAVTTGGAGGSTVNGASNPIGTTGFIAHLVDRTGNRAQLFTHQEKIIGTQGTYATVALGVGSSGGNSADAGYLYAALFTGAAAELSDAQVKTLLQTLGWTIPWS